MTGSLQPAAGGVVMGIIAGLFGIGGGGVMGALDGRRAEAVPRSSPNDEPHRRHRQLPQQGRHHAGAARRRLRAGARAAVAPPPRRWSDEFEALFIEHAAASLEKQLGLRVFERSRRDVVATPAGDDVLRMADELVTRAEAISNRLQDRKSVV